MNFRKLITNIMINDQDWKKCDCKYIIVLERSHVPNDSQILYADPNLD